jgi:MFS family permease
VYQGNSDLTTRQSRRMTRVVAMCVGAIALGLALAHPIAGVFRTSAPWILPVLVVGLLLVLLLVVLLVLPQFSRRAKVLNHRIEPTHDE